MSRPTSRLLLLAWVVALLGALTPLAVEGLDQGDGAAPTPGIRGVQGQDACGLLSDDEVLRATATTRIVERIPNSQHVRVGSCAWRLAATDGSAEPWKLVVEIGFGGRERFEGNLLLGGEPRFAGIGDGAAALMGDLIAYKGDVYLRMAYDASGGERTAFHAMRKLAWLIMSRLSESDATGPSFPPMVTPPPLSEARELAQRIRATEFGPDVVDATVELLARSGIGTYATADAAEPVVPVTEPASPMALLAFQVRAMALEAWATGGILGSDIDALVPAGPDEPLASWIVAGYVAAVDTLGAQVARELLGDQDWSRSAAVLVPQLVLTLMTSDLARDRMSEAGATAQRHRPAAIGLALADGADVLTAQTGLCSVVASFISNAISTVFNALRLDESGGGSIFTAIWNYVVGLAEKAFRAVLREFGQPALDMIGRVAAAVGGLASIVSAIRPWTVTITSDPLATDKGINEVPGESGVLVARVDLGGMDAWPTELESCAREAGKPLPNLKPEGAPVEWLALWQEPSDLVAETGHETKLDADGTARLSFTTLVDQIPGPYSVETGWIHAVVTIKRPAVETLRTIAEDELLSFIRPELRGLVKAWADPIIDRISGKVDELVSTTTSDLAVVAYHVPESTPPAPAPTPAPRGWFVHLDRPDMPGLLLPGRTLEIVSCGSPYGPWSGVYRLGGIIFSDEFTLPIVETPLAFTFPRDRGVQRTTVTLNDGWQSTRGPVAWVVGLDMEVVADGRTLTFTTAVSVMENVDGQPLLGVIDQEPVRGPPLPLEPAPPGMCP